MTLGVIKPFLFMMLASSSINGVGTIADGAQAAHARQVGAGQLHPGGLIQENRRLQERVDSAYVAASEEFAYELVGADLQENPIHAARPEWQARIARCSDEGCRHSLLIEELNRLRFPFRTSRQQIPHVPWRTGSFRIDYRDGGGDLQILPIIDDLILIRVVTSERPNAAWICDLTAYGRIRPNGTATLKVIGIASRFTLATGNRGEIVLSPIGPEPNGPPGCPVRGRLWGTYRPHYGR